MQIRHNISAMIANRNRSSNSSKLTKNLEKLSTGYRINRAADDAAGLSLAEKMSAIITGMDRAIDNINEGVGLIQVGEGALQEVHDMLHRLKQLSLQSAHGIYADAPDRSALQAELEHICGEIERIASTTKFNSIPLFQDKGLSAETASAYTVDASPLNPSAPTLTSLLADRSSTLKNIIYTETVYDFETDQTPAGSTNSFSGTNLEIANTLKTSIVPQVVSKLVSTYPAFGYLSGSSIGIGLELYSDSTSSVLASVALGTSFSTSGGVTTSDTLTYSLRVNTAKVDLSTAAGRNSLEQTIAHEMVHALMDEATTVGMTGVSSSGQSESNKFPNWFVEGMAQTASGPDNWTRGVSLGLTASSSESDIQAALSGPNALGTNSTASEYGTGYLACMYLGYLASGGTADMNDPTAAAAAISAGLSDILANLIDGDSLQNVISAATGGKYASISAFESSFASDETAQAFIKELLVYTSDEGADGVNVGGGLISGSLSAVDPVADSTVTGLKLFELNTGRTEVQNTYPPEITVLSGGAASVEGVPPVAAATPSVPYPADLFTVTGGTAGTDWEFDTNTGILKILNGTSLTISGGTLKNASGDFYGSIVIADGINANLTLDGVAIDTTKRTGNSAGITIGNGSNVTITTSGENTITGSGTCAGIQLTGNDIYNKDTATKDAEHAAINNSSLTLNIADGSKLTVTGGTVGHKGGAGIGAAWSTDTSKSDITITGGGDLIANGGNGGAGIGGSEGGDIGNITITGTSDLDITAKGGAHGAGIGGGGWVSTYPDGPQDVASITITGDVNINASSAAHGTGIGSGCHGSVGTITIGDGSANDNEINITATGGADGAGIGGGWDSTMGSITINGGNITADAGSRGAGIGSGFQGVGGGITINGGIISSIGDTNASGIGGGMNGTISDITITGGTITADGGWTNDGGNIGGYTDESGSTKATVTIKDPSGLTIKAGENGEGKYITTGAVDEFGNPLYALDLSYIAELLRNGEIPGLPAGTELAFPLDPVEVTTADTGTSYTWPNLKHSGENSAYIWMKGEDITLTFRDDNAVAGTVTLNFYPDYGLWRVKAADLPPELPKEPGYVSTGGGAAPPPATGGAIVIQAGAYTGDRVYIPRFYFSKTALGLDALDIATQDNAQTSIGLIDAMVHRVSDIRGQYGALQNALTHISEHLGISIENMTEAVSVVRDTDMAEEMMEYTKNNILLQSAQAMLAQANTKPEGVLQLFQ